MEKVYSNRLGQSYIEFLDRKFGKDVTDRILDRCGIDRLRMADASDFHSAEESIALQEAIVELTGERDMPYIAGRNLPNSVGKIGGFVVGITSPAFLMKTFGQTEAKLARKTLNQTTRVGRGRYRVDITFKDGFKEPALVCRNRIGVYESAPLFFGLPYAKVEHPQCAHQGADHCVYYIDFPDFGFSALLRACQVLLATALVLAGVWFASSGRDWALTGALSAASLGFLSYAAYRGRSAKRALEWSLHANDGLAQQNQALEKAHLRSQSLQDMTTALNKGFHIQDVCDRVVGMMVSRFHYGSSQIWLLDGKRELLSCHSAIGYSDDLRAFISNTRFRIGENWDNPYGLLIQVLEERKTLIVNEPEDLLPRLTGRSQEFLRALKLSSFIMTPLLHEDEPIGLLAAEHHHGEKVGNPDKVLFQSISNIVANAVVKADLFERMEEKIRQRTLELEAANRQLLAAKEMAIQSEKLSALGQMAAGVAHEINNPLNFLVNIIPDVRRDVEALEKIRALALDGSANGSLADAIRKIDEEYDLESHLEEKDFVFGRIQKALDKSTRIANSLKVFSRSSSKETLAREPFAGMVREVVDLIPQKSRGDTRIEVNIPADLAWTVNKNEVEQAFLALINNAIDAMGQKGCVRISAVRERGDIVLTFRDEGPGIPPEALKRIFDPFYTTKPPGKGTGLGLTIASEIVRKYGGLLSAESEPGLGATFLIRFRNAQENIATAGPKT